MKSMIARIPTSDEFEAIILDMGMRIVSIREEFGERKYTVQAGRLTIEIPTQFSWRVIE